MDQPPWVSSFRPQQVFAIQSILESFQNGTNIVLFDAPTGSGKTLIGEMVRRELKTRGIYLCSSLTLQSQFARDFPTAAILRGRTNYPTFDDGKRFPNLNAGDCIKERTTVPACLNCTSSTAVGEAQHCKWCHPVQSCPYEQAKYSAIRSPLACTNTYYFLYEANFVSSLTVNRGLIVVDEADTLETILLSFVGVEISSRRAKEYGITPPALKTVESSWIEWAESAAKTLHDCLVAKRKGTSLDDIRYRIRTSRLLDNVRRLNDPKSGIQAGGWVYTGYDKGDIAFKPIQVDNLARDFLWRHCERWLLMSASMISFPAIVESLGIENVDVVAYAS